MGVTGLVNQALNMTGLSLNGEIRTRTDDNVCGKKVIQMQRYFKLISFYSIVRARAQYCWL